MAFWNKKSKATARIAATEDVFIAALGGRVSVRGLLPNEAQGLTSAIRRRLSEPAEQKAALMVLMLRNGVVTPHLDEAEALNLAREHPDAAVTLVQRISRLTEARFREFGIIA